MTQQPIPLRDQKWPEGTQPVVTIFCITYNHEKFIRDAIEGFLMQETTFPVEIFIHDDASSDDTANIIKDYDREYPRLFWSVLQKENQYLKNRFKFFFDYLARQRGEFIAFCEGDDYWTTPQKLQRQVDLLKANPHYSMCFAKANELNQLKKTYSKGTVSPSFLKSAYELNDLLEHGHLAPTLTQVHRASVIRAFPEKLRNCPIGDLPLTFWAATHGALAMIHESMAVYRIHSGGVHSGQACLANNNRYLNAYTQTARILGLDNTPAYQRGVTRFRFNVVHSCVRQGMVWKAVAKAIPAAVNAPKEQQAKRWQEVLRFFKTACRTLFPRRLKKLSTAPVPSNPPFD